VATIKKQSIGSSKTTIREQITHLLSELAGHRKKIPRRIEYRRFHAEKIKLIDHGFAEQYLEATAKWESFALRFLASDDVPTFYDNAADELKYLQRSLDFINWVTISWFQAKNNFFREFYLIHDMPYDETRDSNLIKWAAAVSHVNESCAPPAIGPSRTYVSNPCPRAMLH